MVKNLGIGTQILMVISKERGFIVMIVVRRCISVAIPAKSEPFS
jgi:hypothetical protein